MDGRSEPHTEASPPAPGECGKTTVRPRTLLFGPARSVIIKRVSLSIFSLGTVCAWRLVVLDAKPCQQFLVRLHTATSHRLIDASPARGARHTAASVSRASRNGKGTIRASSSVIKVRGGRPLIRFPACPSSAFGLGCALSHTKAPPPPHAPPPRGSPPPFPSARERLILEFPATRRCQAAALLSQSPP